jgi:transcriptional regulator with XRE-family HTH domain
VIRELRAKRDLTQEELAKAAKVTRSYIAVLESGHRKNPSLAILKRLAGPRRACDFAAGVVSGLCTHDLLRRGIVLEAATVGWNVVEGLIATSEEVTGDPTPGSV